MSYDRIWFCPTLYRKDWSELRAMKEEERKRVLPQYEVSGSTFAVRLSAGENYLFDELYLFLKEADAIRFFDGGPLVAGEKCYRDMEYRHHGRPIGFDTCSLQINGKVVAWDNPRNWKREYWNQLPNRPKQLS
jgi:hypothetical protein